MLYLLPDELLVAIVEYCDQNTRKNLSLVSRRLRDPSQFIIFKTVHVSRHKFETIVPRFAVEGGGHLPEVMQNDRLVSYIQTLVISPDEAFQHLEVNTIELLFTALHKMQPLRDIKLVAIPFTTTMLDRLCEVLSTRLYDVELWDCLYPADYTIQQAALKIRRLSLLVGRGWFDTAPLPTTKALVAIIQRSLSNITSLTLSSGVGLLAYFGTLPRLTSLNILPKSDINDGGLSKFLVANPQLVEFALDGPLNGLSLCPPSALPNLRILRVFAELVQHLLPGRPIVKVEICHSPRPQIMLDGLCALSRSAAPIVELTLHLHRYTTHLHEILEVVVKMAPRLERIWLSFQAELSQIVLDHLVRLGSLREVNLSAYISHKRWDSYSSKKSTIERNSREVLKSSIYLTWSKFTVLDELFTNESDTDYPLQVCIGQFGPENLRV